MSRVWFATELETVATFWRVLRRDGVTLGFTSHDHDLWFDGILHAASPGMVPSAIRRLSGFEADSAEVQGALTHEAVTGVDLSEGRFDGAQVRIGVIDWETLENRILYRGRIGNVIEEDGSFTAELQSRKAELLEDPIPRTSPNCRALFCGPDCALNPAKFTHDSSLISIDPDRNAVALAFASDPANFVGGWVRWLEGPQAGITMGVTGSDATTIILDVPLDPGVQIGARLQAREGCDHTLDTCSVRFENAVNFRGEPFLPGNDLLTRYPSPVPQ